MAKQGIIQFFFKGDNKNLKKTARETETVLDKVDKKGQKSASGIGKAFSAAFSAASAVISGAFLSSIIKSGAAMEQTRVAFTTMLGSAEQATTTINGLREFANVTPFITGEVIKAGQSLVAFGVSADEVGSKLKVIGDIAAGVNVPLNDLANIYGKILTKGKIQAEEINQLSERGVPILKTLAKELGVSTQTVLDLGSKGKLTSDVFEEAMAKMTDKGGQFNDMMKKQSQTVTGLTSTIQGKLQDAITSFGEELSGVLKPILEFTIDLWDSLGKDGQKALLTIAAALAVVIGAIGAMKTAVLLLGGSWKLAFGGVGLIIAGIVTAVVLATKKSDILKKHIENLVDQIKILGLRLKATMQKVFGSMTDAEIKANDEAIANYQEGIKKRKAEIETLKKAKQKANEDEKKSIGAIEGLKKTAHNAELARIEKEKAELNKKAQEEARNAEKRKSFIQGQAMSAPGQIFDTILMGQETADTNQDQKDAAELEQLQLKNENELIELQNKADGEIAIEEAKLKKIQKDKTLSDAQKVKAEAEVNAKLKILRDKKAHDEKALRDRQVKEEKELQRTQAIENHKRETAIFNTRKAANIADVVMNTATAIVKGFGTLGPIGGGIFAAFMGALGGAKISIIANQDPPPAPAFATGGVIEGIGTGTSDSINARVSNGEAIINASRTDKLFSFIDELTANKGSAGNVQVNFEPGAVQGINTSDDFVEMVSDSMARRLEQLV